MGRGLWLSLTTLCHLPRPGAHTQVVQVNDSMYGFIGTDVVLHCSFANPLPGVKITQVTWQKATNGSKQNVAIYNPAMGVSVLAPYRERVEFLRPSFTDGTIRLSRLELEDEGVYICEFATFPAGNRESQLNLTVMGKLTGPLLSAWVGPVAWGLGHLQWPQMRSLGRHVLWAWHFWSLLTRLSQFTPGMGAGPSLWTELRISIQVGAPPWGTFQVARKQADAMVRERASRAQQDSKKTST